MPRRIVTAFCGGPPPLADGGIAMTSTRSPGKIMPETPLTRSIGMLTARIPGRRRTGSARATFVPIFDKVIWAPTGIVTSVSEPTACSGLEIASGSSDWAGRISL